MIARIHSYQTMGTLDGPGVRFVVFMQGCPLACAYCHNPDTWDLGGGREISVDDLKNTVLRYRSYFGVNGGITVSGGEPLLQAAVITELFKLCKAEGIHTTLDTSGFIFNESICELLNYVDLCMLDYKFSNEDGYASFTKASHTNVVRFLSELNDKNISVWIRQVVVPGINDSEESLKNTAELVKKYPCIEKIELLPFKKICYMKYDEMGIEFPFLNMDEPTAEQMKRYNEIVDKYK